MIIAFNDQASLGNVLIGAWAAISPLLIEEIAVSFFMFQLMDREQWSVKLGNFIEFLAGFMLATLLLGVL